MRNQDYETVSESGAEIPDMFKEEWNDKSCLGKKKKGIERKAE